MIETYNPRVTVGDGSRSTRCRAGNDHKTMSFWGGRKCGSDPLTEGTARVDNRKYKDTFHVSKMIPFNQVRK